jgi:hypothetical protein
MFSHVIPILVALATSNVVLEDRSVEPAATTEVSERQVTITISPVRIEAGAGYHHHGPDGRVAFDWPEDGWVNGYQMELVDADGAVLPIEMLHHAGVVNLGRRQLAYPMMERLFAVGRETGHVTLPGWMGLRMSADQPMAVYFALVNPSGPAIEGASLRMTYDWRPIASGAELEARPPRPRTSHHSERARRAPGEIVEIVPLIVSANPNDGFGSVFDVPSGRSEKRAEFTLPVGGRLRALGGHLHDYAVELRLEDAETGRVLVRLDARTAPDGTLDTVETDYFLTRPMGFRLEANRRYRVVGVYDNPTGFTLPGGAMAYMAGPFVPDDASRWPEVDPNDPMYARDRARLMGESAAAGQDTSRTADPASGVVHGAADHTAGHH